MNQNYKNCLEEGLAFQDYVTEKLYDRRQEIQEREEERNLRRAFKVKV